ncbi:uncharacterized protein LOC143281873 isoform X2 [Babylonia areolata]|uniref:uncharacterized protein LOC143281873 isoform X2 n=1 Tax=Babylonia areolata TaxID=304850 RepID=UPI003FD1335A
MGHMRFSHILFSVVLFISTDGLDAQNSGGKPDFQLRLVGGSNDREGRVEVRLADGEWGNICDDGFGGTDATVVCRQLKLGLIGIMVQNAQYGTPPRTTYLDDMDCMGTESNVLDCGHRGWGIHNCKPSEAVSVRCLEDNFQLRLVGGSNDREGRVEVRLDDGDWGNICDDGFGARDATVVCRQLKLGLFGNVVQNAQYGTPPRTTYLDNMGCMGTESNVLDCGHRAWGNHNCQPSQAVSVRCLGDNFQLRLDGGSNDREGRVEVRLGDGEWGNICDDHFGARDATVVCRQLKLGLFGNVVQNAPYGTPPRTTYLDNMDCKGTESNVLYCGHLGWGIHDCQPSEAVSVRCLEDTTTLTPSSSSKLATTSPETTTTPLAESDKTSILRNLTKSAATEQTVVQTRQVLQQRGETSAADVVEVAEILRRASQLQNLSAQTATDLLEIVDTVAELNLTVLHKSNSVGNTTNRLIGVVEQLADKVSLEEGPVRLQTSSTVLQVWNLTAAPQSPVFGLRLNTAGETQDVTSVNNQSDADTFADVDTAVMLPGEIGRSIVEDNSGRDVRLSASVIKQTSLFQVGKQRDTTHTDTPEAQSTDRDTEDRPTAGVSLNSKVISLRITVDGRPVTDLSAFGQGNVTAVFLPLEPLSEKLSGEWRERTQCVFWDFAERQGAGGWSRKGCHLEGIVSDKMICLCDHLTNFAILMDLYEPDVKRARFHENLLSTISLVGLTFSICGLSITLLAFILVKKLHKSLPQQTLFNMSLALLLSWVTFLAGIQRVEDHVTCVAVAMLLHYFILVTFLWMLAQGVLQYFMLVKAMKRPFTRYMLKAGLLAWGLPVLPVIIVSAVDVELYRGREDYCWMSLTAFYYAFLAPIAVIVTINIVIYLLVVVSICRRPNLSSGGTSYTAISVRASVSCFVVLGLSWIFAFMAVEDARLVFQYLFAVTTTFQGFLIFLLYTARDRDVRGFFMSKFRKEDRSSTVSEHRRPSGPRRNVETPSTKETSFTRSK